MLNQISGRFEQYVTQALVVLAKVVEAYRPEEDEIVTLLVVTAIQNVTYVILFRY